MASPGSQLPGGFILGALSHADRIGLVYEAFPAEGRGLKSRALVLHPLNVEELRDWFERTAVLGRGLKHPNLVEVHALGYTANQLPVMITEWTDGRTLRSRLAGGEVIDVGEVRRIIDEVASALDYLHDRNPPVLHRVVMPETVLIPPSPLPVKLLAVGHADRPQHPASKVNYLSPEELSGEVNLTPAADIFSLATLAFEALTGRAAFPGNSASAVISAVQRRVLPYIALAPMEGLEPLDELFHGAWSADPEQRPASAGDFAARFARALESVPSMLLTSRRTVREGVLRAGTIPPTAGVTGPRPQPMRGATPVPGTARVSTRPPPMGSRQASNRPISPFLGAGASAPPRVGTAPGHSMLPARSVTGVSDVSGAYRRGEDDANSWLNLDVSDRAARPSTVVNELPAAGASPAELPTPLPGPLDVGDAEITSANVDIDDPEVLELLSEEFTSPALPSSFPRGLVEYRAPQFEGDFADQPASPVPAARPSNRPPPVAEADVPRARPRSQTMPSGFPGPMRSRTPVPAQLAERPQLVERPQFERPPQFDRPPVSPLLPGEPRGRAESVRVPWHSREIRVTPWLIALVLALNLVLTAALAVVLRYLLG
jgi:serine/threonine-protein kinase